MNTPKEIIQFLAHYNSWRRGDETIEQPSPDEIGAAIDDAVHLLRQFESVSKRAQCAEWDSDGKAKQLREYHKEIIKLRAEAKDTALIVGKAMSEELRLGARLDTCERALQLLTSAVESAVCDSDGAVAFIFEREPGFDKCRLQIALDRARQTCAAIPIDAEERAEQMDQARIEAGWNKLQAARAAIAEGGVK